MVRWVASLVFLGLAGCSWAAPDDCRILEGHGAYAGKRDGADIKRTSIPVRLTPVLGHCGDVVDIQFVPGSADKAVVIDQQGTAWWVDLAAKTSGKWLHLDTTAGGERGLLGLAFHPQFTENGRFFMNWTATKEGQLVSRVGAFQAEASAPFASEPAQRHLVYEVDQPYTNHNGGNLAFGPDGKLYVGFGDGGKFGDPHGNGQDKGTALGAMLRLDVDGDPPFTVPPDNPFVGQQGALPELWAIGLRNPWRWSWDADGRLIVADVGQNEWEEVTVLTAGANAGWNAREARHCYEPAEGCPTEGLVEPIWEYSHREGRSITGGYVAGAPEAIAGRFIAGDFGSGRIWGIALPDSGPATDVAALGRFPIKISTFGRDAKGQVYVSGYSDGTVYRIDANE